MSTVYEGVKWGDGLFGTTGGTVTYTFAGPFDPTYYDYSAELSAAFQAVVADAFEKWSDYADIQFEYTAEVASADIALGWDRIDGFDGTLAETIYQYSPVTSELIWAEIRFDVAEDWVMSGDLSSSWQTDFYAVALHEIGHAIGLDHTSDLDSIMYTWYGSVFDLTGTDITGIQALYGSPELAWSPLGTFFANTADPGGWNEGWYKTGDGLILGWHTEAGWDTGWYLDHAGWHNGWFYHAGWEYGWYDTGAWTFGQYYDYGGYGWGGTNIAWYLYGWDGGLAGDEDWGWLAGSRVGWSAGRSIDYGGWNYGWYESGTWLVGWHIEGGWEYGWFRTRAAWDYGWFVHEGWEYGWYTGGGVWRHGWFYDYGGQGWGWNIGWQVYGWDGGWIGHESWY